MKLYPEAWELFAASGRLQTEASLSSYRQHVRRLAFLNPKNGVGAYTPQDLLDYCLMGTPSSNTIASRRNAVQAIFKWLAWKKLIPKDPSVHLGYELPKHAGPVKVHRWLTKEEFGAILDSCPESPTGWRDRTLFSTAALTGLRGSELAGLGWDNLDDDLAEITLVGKGRKLATIGVPEQLTDALGTWRQVAPSGALAVFPRVNNGTLNLEWDQKLGYGGVYDAIKLAGKRAGIDVSPHDLRRTYAEFLRTAKFPVEDIQLAMRHSNLATTSRYLQQSPEKAVKVGRGLKV